MGMDVYIEGELTIPASKVLKARDLLLAALAKPNWGYGQNEPWTPGEHDIYETPEEIVGLIEGRLERIGIELCDDNSIEFGLEDSTRHEEYDQWLFEALAPVIDDGVFYLSGDEYRWIWEIKNGKFREINGEMIFDHDEKAVPTIAKIISLVYCEGKPLSTCYPQDEVMRMDALERAIYEIENLLRETGYGPQAGKNELDRLAEV